MTSSLVGSEMCIRDRMYKGNSRWRGEVAFASVGTFRGCSAKPCHDMLIKAVSYTHLTLPTICSV
eukprot:7524964-Prorocentrum_lima.AAC.1